MQCIAFSNDKWQAHLDFIRMLWLSANAFVDWLFWYVDGLYDLLGFLMNNISLLALLFTGLFHLITINIISHCAGFSITHTNACVCIIDEKSRRGTSWAAPKSGGDLTCDIKGLHHRPRRFSRPSSQARVKRREAFDCDAFCFDQQRVLQKGVRFASSKKQP